MKFKLLALTCFLAALSCFNLNAQAHKVNKPKATNASKLSKDSKDSIFFEASDTNPFVFTGSSVNPTFVPLPFTQQKLHHGHSIQPNATGTQFLLEKGTYLVLFTGTFQTDDSTGHQNIGIFFDVALQLGSNTIFINTDSHEPLSTDFDPIGISSTNKVLEVDKPTNLSVVVRGTTDLSTVTALTRSLTILKLNEGSTSSFFGASSATGIPLMGTANPIFVPLSFGTHQHSHGKAIKLEGDSCFRLEKGTYLVMFSGTFDAFTSGDDVSYASFDVALKLGSNVFFINTDSHDATGGDTTGVSAITKVFEVNEPTDFSLVARANQEGGFVNASFRSINILKLK
jgi:hypothetical protein